MVWMCHLDFQSPLILILSILTGHTKTLHIFLETILEGPLGVSFVCFSQSLSSYISVSIGFTFKASKLP